MGVSRGFPETLFAYSNECRDDSKKVSTLRRRLLLQVGAAVGDTVTPATKFF